MTFRQIIDVLWQRKLLIVAVIAVAFIAAGAYLALQVKSYSSTAEVRTSVLVTTAASGGELDGVQVDFDPTTLTSPKVLSQVAKATGSTEAAISASVSYEVSAGKDTNTFAITAVGSTPKEAQARANSVISVYTAYLKAQISTALKTLTARQTATNQLAVQYEQETNTNPKNSIAAANLNNALADLGTLNTEIDSLNNSGSPMTPLTDTPLGSPVGPSPAIVLAIAVASGLIAGIGIVLIRDQFDNRLRGDFEIEGLTGLPSLGELTFDRTLRRRRDTLPAASSDQTQLSEGLRSLRTSMQVLLPREHAVVVLTSVEPGDGKTFISANLALAWARTGRRVIVVGGDLRRPSLSTYFEAAAAGPGLSEILREASTPQARPIGERVEQYLADTGFAGLRVLPAGFEASDPADLLATAALREVIEALRAHADIVVIDSPPAMALIDANLLAEYADGVIVVASIRKTDRSALAATVDVLAHNGAAPIGVIANLSRRRLPKAYAPYYRAAPDDLSAATRAVAPSGRQAAEPVPAQSRSTEPRSSKPISSKPTSSKPRAVPSKSVQARQPPPESAASRLAPTAAEHHAGGPDSVQTTIDDSGSYGVDLTDAQRPQVVRKPRPRPNSPLEQHTPAE